MYPHCSILNLSNPCHHVHKVCVTWANLVESGVILIHLGNDVVIMSFVSVSDSRESITESELHTGCFNSAAYDTHKLQR